MLLLLDTHTLLGEIAIKYALARSDLPLSAAQAIRGLRSATWSSFRLISPIC
jgi:hypothetical protein